MWVDNTSAHCTSNEATDTWGGGEVLGLANTIGICWALRGSGEGGIRIHRGQGEEPGSGVGLSCEARVE